MRGLERVVTDDVVRPAVETGAATASWMRDCRLRADVLPKAGMEGTITVAKDPKFGGYFGCLNRGSLPADAA